ncbi:3-hydroxyacyl-ACP dehydratase FabZ [bacterium]|nr:3-hydroxyacyl-ACP dehydratase FabZ [bacterium]
MECESGESVNANVRDGFDVNEIKKLIPHRYPFLLVDRVLNWTPGVEINAIKNLSVNESFFNGHFPQRPVMPGVLIIEALAQSAGILAKISEGFEPAEGNEYFLVGLGDVKWRRQVLPGDTLNLHAKLVKKKRQLLIIQGTATVDGELAASAHIHAAEVQV